MRDWDWHGAEEEYRLALDLNGNDPLAHFALGEYLEAMGRLEEGMQERQRAQDLEPAVDDISVGYFRARRYDVAAEIVRKRLEILPDDGGLHYQLSFNYAYGGRENDSIAELQRAADLFGFKEGAENIGHAFTVFGYRGALQTLTKGMEQAYVQGQIDRPDLVAEAYTRLGEKEKAFRWLQKAYQERNARWHFSMWNHFGIRSGLTRDSRI
jgi:tetratricopeptide (TPR) repeat protein